MYVKLSQAIRLAVLVTAIMGCPAAQAGPRIFNGTSLSGALPWMAFVTTSTTDGAQVCGGTAIAANVVLTAAHCIVDQAINTYVSAGQIGVTFGLSDPWGALGSGTLTRAPVLEYDAPSTYGSFVSGGGINDIALLRLRDAAPATISLVPSTRTDLLSAPRSAAVVGWGQTRPDDDDSLPSSLQLGAFTIQKWPLCKQHLPNYDATVMLCAWGNSTTAVCHGDSGGPLLVLGGAQTFYVAGVVSWAQPCDPSAPGVFANVASGPLATFTTKYAAELQQTADASAAVEQPQIPSEPSTTPPATAPVAVTPFLSWAKAVATARRYARRTWGWAVKRTSCSRVSRVQLTCWVQGTKRGRQWSSHMKITASGNRVSVSAA
jgi:secreted trypsin-like serine protease